jgi:hypothetical protein
MNEKGFQPQFYRKLGYNKSRDVIPQRKRQWDGLVIPQLELKKPNQYKTHAEMIYTYDLQCMKSPYPVSRMDLPAVGKFFGGDPGLPPWTPPVVTVTLPIVITVTVSAVTATTATSGGVVTYDGGASVTARGVCWGTTQNPTIANSKTTDGGGMGVFSSSLTGLSASTAYFARAYATNSAGTAYGNQESFTSSATAGVFCAVGADDATDAYIITSSAGVSWRICTTSHGMDQSSARLERRFRHLRRGLHGRNDIRQHHT